MFTFNSNYFTWRPEDKTLSAYASDLPEKNYNPVQTIPGTTKKGCKIKGNNETLTFEVYKVDTDGEDIYGWNLKPTQDSVRRVPKSEGLRVLIIND